MSTPTDGTGGLRPTTPDTSADSGEQTSASPKVLRTFGDGPRKADAFHALWLPPRQARLRQFSSDGRLPRSAEAGSAGREPRRAKSRLLEGGGRRNCAALSAKAWVRRIWNDAR